MSDHPQQPLRDDTARVDELPRKTRDELRTAPLGLYLVVDDAGALQHRPFTSPPARLLARVRQHFGRHPTAVYAKYLRKDGLQIVEQWEDQLGAWPEDVPEREARAITPDAWMATEDLDE